MVEKLTFFIKIFELAAGNTKYVLVYNLISMTHDNEPIVDAEAHNEDQTWLNCHLFEYRRRSFYKWDLKAMITIEAN